jgi:hypothetical protein
MTMVSVPKNTFSILHHQLVICVPADVKIKEQTSFVFKNQEKALYKGFISIVC